MSDLPVVRLIRTAFAWLAPRKRRTADRAAFRERTQRVVETSRQRTPQLEYQLRKRREDIAGTFGGPR